MSAAAPSAIRPVDAAPRLTAWKVGLIFALFFGTVFCADAVLLYSALSTHTGAETTSAYRAGQLYNREIELARLQEARGWRLAVTAQRVGSGAVAVDAILAGAGPASAPRELSATLRRPTDQRGDRAETRLVAAGGDRHYGVVSDVAPGQWDLVVDVLEGGERVFRRKTRIVIP